MIGNLKEAIENNLEYLDGYDEIDEESQAKVRTALEVGHVADEDWKGVWFGPGHWFDYLLTLSRMWNVIVLVKKDSARPLL